MWSKLSSEVKVGQFVVAAGGVSKLLSLNLVVGLEVFLHIVFGLETRRLPETVTAQHFFVLCVKDQVEHILVDRDTSPEFFEHHKWIVKSFRCGCTSI